MNTIDRLEKLAALLGKQSWSVTLLVLMNEPGVKLNARDMGVGDLHFLTQDELDHGLDAAILSVKDKNAAEAARLRALADEVERR